MAHGTITLRLALDPGNRQRVVASPAHGAASLTRFERLARVAAPRSGLSLLRCRLVTGRRHQIRVHLAASGWPLVGDPSYGEPRWAKVVDPALAAALVAFRARPCTHGAPHSYIQSRGTRGHRSAGAGRFGDIDQFSGFFCGDVRLKADRHALKGVPYIFRRNTLHPQCRGRSFRPSRERPGHLPRPSRPSR